MIKGSSTHVRFVCDSCGAEEPGRMLDIPGTPRQVAVEPIGWEKRDVRKLSGYVFRHYCLACNQTAASTTKVLKFVGA